jgi:hypothetical protein
VSDEVVAADYQEETATDRVAAVPLAHLSVEIGHLYMEDFAERAGDRLVEYFERLAPWVRAARESLPVPRPRISTCFLIDDYFVHSTRPGQVLPAVLDAARRAGVDIDYVAREAACAQTGPTSPAELVLARLVPEPPPGSTGSRPPPQVAGWLCNGVRTPVPALNQALSEPPGWQPPSENGANRHSVFIDVQLFNDIDTGPPDNPGRQRVWSCPFLSAVWQLLRLGALRDYGGPVWSAQPLPATWPESWAQLPALSAVRPGAAPFAAHRTVSVLDGRFLPVEHAVRTILGQYHLAPAVRDRLAEAAERDAVVLPDELVDRVGYAFVTP